MASFEAHCVLGFLIRILMIIYGTVQDEIADVKYTDVDYKVFTDAANEVVKGGSPFDRYTYRYSPLLAYILVPNILLHRMWGNVLFSFCDIIICVLIRKLLKVDKINERLILWSVFFWLYSPMSIIISTRGNADSLSSLLVLSTLLMLKTKHYLLAGIVHGISIHFRIYPIAFSLCMYLSVMNNGKPIMYQQRYKQFIQKIIPTANRLKLTLSSIFTLMSITYGFYLLYGYTFLFESFLYHLQRFDIRHNFSVYFYLQYLSSAIDVSIVQRVLMVLPQFTLLLVISFVYSDMRHIYFCHFLIAYIMVTYNTVLTSQYFIWFLCIMPLIIPRLKVSKMESFVLIVLWGVGQLAWLLPAYLLEFRNYNTFIHLWFQSLLFFCVNILIITRLIANYDRHDKYK